MAKASTFTDGFATLDGALWTTGGDGSPVGVVGGVLKIQYGTGAFGSSQATTIATYDLTGSSVMVQLADIGTRQTGWEALLYVVGAGSNNSARMYFSEENGVVAQVFNAGATVFEAGGVAFDENVHKWMRIRETSGTLFFETSSNGVSWATAFSTASSVVTWSLTTVKLQLEAARSTAQATGGYSSFDNLNLPPATPHGNFFRFFTHRSGNIGGDPGGGPPPSGGGSAYIQAISDIDYLHWDPLNTGNPPVPENSSFHTISAPSGPGFEIVCTDANETAWNSGTYKAVLAQKNNTTALGQTQDWTWDMYLPSQTINKYQGVLWQWHTNSSSGHFMGIDQGSLTYRYGRQSAYGEIYDIVSGVVPVVFNVWKPFRIQVKWSLGSDGFLRRWIDGVQVYNYSGPTQFANDGTPYLQFGWYGEGGTANPSGVTNIVRFANIQRTVS